MVVEGYALPEMKADFTLQVQGWAPENIRTGRVVLDATRPIQAIDIFPPGQTDQHSVVYMEETTFTPAAAERAESAAYAEATFELTERTSRVRSIGASVPVTDEQLADVPAVRSYLNQRLTFGVRQRLDGQILVGNGTAPNHEWDYGSNRNPDSGQRLGQCAGCDLQGNGESQGSLAAPFLLTLFCIPTTGVISDCWQPPMESISGVLLQRLDRR